ncbi:MAG: hypothetical protein QOK12_982, partial [Mycobacterium sp.]|nr:hypothetical protein [Mycobacterium sp.]
MAKHRQRVSGSGRTRTPGRAWAVAIGGAGIVLAAPAAALLTTPALAQAAPVPPTGPLCPLLVGCGSGGGVGASIAGGIGASIGSLSTVVGPGGLADPFGLPTAILGFAGAIPGLNIFIGNGADGTAVHPDGFNGGLFFGDGGKGYSPTTPGAYGGNGGAAGLFFGSGGDGGNGADGDVSLNLPGGNGGNGGAASTFIGNGGTGGAGGRGL